MNKRQQNQIARYKAKVEDFNNDLAAYYKVSDDHQLPEIDSTIIGYSDFEPYEITELPEGGFSVDADGVVINVKVMTDDEGEEFVCGWDKPEFPYADTLKESIAYDRRRLNKAWRIWHSENPDAELEKDDDENE